ncbi:MAG: hypothetical protein ACRYF9_27640 [Janthinobacterium lividum]
MTALELPMSDEALHAEAVGSVILLTRHGRSDSSVLDIRPALLAAHLSAAKLHSDTHELHWKGEFHRVLGLLGCRQTSHTHHDGLSFSRAGWVVHDLLRIGIAKQLPVAMRRPVRQALATVAAAPDSSPGLQVLHANSWRGTALGLQVVLLETDGRLITFGIGFQSPEPVPERWLRHHFNAPRGKAFVYTWTTTSIFSRELYEPFAQGLKTRLGDRLHTHMAAF